jgi:hypothetical protein
MNQQQAKHTPGPWKPFMARAGKARAVTRHWAKGPNGQRAGHFPSEQAAQTYCDQQNAAVVAAAAA